MLIYVLWIQLDNTHPSKLLITPNASATQLLNWYLHVWLEYLANTFLKLRFLTKRNTSNWKCQLGVKPCALKPYEGRNILIEHTSLYLETTFKYAPLQIMPILHMMPQLLHVYCYCNGAYRNNCHDNCFSMLSHRYFKWQSQKYWYHIYSKPAKTSWKSHSVHSWIFE